MRINKIAFDGLAIFLIIFIIASAAADIYYYNRVAQRDPAGMGQISYSDFRVFWIASYDLFNRILRFRVPSKNYPVFRHFWFLDPKWKDSLDPLYPEQYPVYNKEDEFYHFRYSPFAAFAMMPMAKIRPPSRALIVWYIMLNAAFLAALLLMSRKTEKDLGLDKRYGYHILWLAFLGGSRFYLTNISLGQTDIFILLLFALFLTAYLKDREVLCGILLALILQFKPFFAPSLFYFLITKRVRIVLSTAAAFAALLFIPSYMLGMAQTISLLRGWVDILKVSVPSQLLNAKNLSLTYMIGYPILKAVSLKDISLLPDRLFYAIGALLTLSSYLFLAYFKRARAREGGTYFKYVEIGMVVIVSLLFSPITWLAHYITILIPFFAVLGFLFKMSDKTRRFYLLLIGLFMLSCLAGSDMTKYLFKASGIYLVNMAATGLFLVFLLMYGYARASDRIQR